MAEKLTIPRLVLAALKGGAGKTFLTVGIVAALRKRGLSVAVFKKGPDYIDAGWLGLAAGHASHNLDAFLFDTAIVAASFARVSSGRDFAIVEGNRGLFDGVDAAGSYSTAELAKALRTPVILIVDATKVTRTAAAMVLGCRCLDPTLDVKGVILNRVAGARHESVLRESIENASCVPVIGSVKKLSSDIFPQRHLGLVPSQEHPRSLEFIEEAAETVRRSIDLDRLVDIASQAGDFDVGPLPDILVPHHTPSVSGVRVGIMKDSAFQFYYPENLEALARGGAHLVEISGLTSTVLPELDALYIGGGFPETHAGRLADNVSFKESLRAAVQNGLPVYAECGGLMYLSKRLRIDDKIYPMVGVFPVDSVLERTPQGHGYLSVQVVGPNPFYPPGAVITGHEFHYSHVELTHTCDASYAFRVVRGHGMDGSRDGMHRLNVLGTYLHVHALGEPLWADGILNRAGRYRDERNALTQGPGDGKRTTQ
jgi:cobyrinic acid a,c-diamide synthase